MLQTDLRLRYKPEHDDEVMQALRDFIKQLEEKNLIKTVEHEDVTTIGI